MQTIQIKLPGQKSYDIHLGYDILDSLGQYIRQVDPGSDVFLLTSPRIASFYQERVVAALQKSGYGEVRVALLPDGEEYKSMPEWQRLLKELTDFDAGMSKRIFVLNLGGGVVGDLGGFLAACYRRGVPFVQVPTTLLAFVDCGIGGKVAVNFEQVKNLIGAFYQPALVYADLKLLDTLEPRQLLSGFAEVIKYGVIADGEFFTWLEQNYQRVLELDREAIVKVAETGYRIKARVVEQDELDTLGVRVILNYGHTFGHALEAATNYRRYTHGEAIAIGMVCAAQMAVTLEMLPSADAQRIAALITASGLPTTIDADIPLADILGSLSHDKKFVNGRNRFVLPSAIGQVLAVEDVPCDVIHSTITDRIAK